MKYFLTASALLFSLVVAAQFPNLPYNPDENGDGLIGVVDLQGLLANYGTEFLPDVTDSIVIYDMQPEIDAFWDAWNGGINQYPTITVPATADKVVLLSTNDDNCSQGSSYCARVNLQVEDSHLYDEVTIVWVTTAHYPYNYFADSNTFDYQGSHFTLINTESGWLGPWRQN